MTASFDAYVAAAAFAAPEPGATPEPFFAVGDGTVRIGESVSHAAHDGAVLCAALHPSGVGLVTGGDDGRVVWTTLAGSTPLATVPRRWIDAIAASPQSGLLAFAAGREVHVLDVEDPAFARVFAHERSIAALAFDPKGRRLAAATYGGVQLWYARIADQKPHLLKWAGSHVAAAFSPDGRFLLSAMQENALHGWRLTDSTDLRMGGYPAKPRSLAFLAKGALLATSGSNGVVVWPFAGAGGPMGKEAAEIGREDGSLVTCVAAHASGFALAAGRSDGGVFQADLRGVGVVAIRSGGGAPISALAVSADGLRAAFGGEDGAFGVVDLV